MSTHRAGIPILLVLLLACGGEEPVDPMDRATIEHDLEERTVRELYEEAERHPWNVPIDHRLTEAHIADFMKVATLAERIVEVAGSRFDEQLESASQAPDRFSKMGAAFSALGSARNVTTAHVRAALTLGVNPHQQQWVGTQMVAASRIAVRRRPYDEAVVNAIRARDQETNAYLRVEKGNAVRETEERLRDFEQTLGDTELANARLVEKHAAELSRFFPFLQRKERLR